MLPTVLVVDDDKAFLSLICQSLQDLTEKIRLLTASNGREAVRILESEHVDLLVTDLRMPEMDGFGLLAYVTNRSLSLCICVITGFRTPATVKQLQQMGISRIWEKPIKIKDFINYVEGVVTGSGNKSHFEGVSIPGLLQLIRSERRTCFLEVLSRNGEKGVLLFQDGEARDAVCGELRGEEAALKIIRWENGRMFFKKTPTERRYRRRINKPLMALLMEAARLLDEDTKKTKAPTPIHHFGEKKGKPPDHVRDAFDDSSEKKVSHTNTKPIWQRETRSKNMAKLSEKLQDMASEIEGVIAMGIIGMDGIGVAHYNPKGASVESYDAKFTMVMKLTDKALKEMEELGNLEETLIQTSEAWLLLRFLNDQYWLGIAVSRESTLGNVRLVANKYTRVLSEAIG